MQTLPFLKLTGGRVYDPSNGVEGEILDIWICNGKIVNPPDAANDVSVIDLSGRVVMAGAVDMHCHIAGPKVNTARKMQPEQVRRSAEMPYDESVSQFELGAIPSVPNIYQTGCRYTGLGYTTCFDAAISPLAARHVHHEFNDIPNVDTGFFVLVGNNHFALDCIANDDHSGLQSFLGWLLHRVGGYAPKIVNPGGVENWKQSRKGNARDLDQPISGFNVTPRRIIQEIAKAANRLQLPHPVHIHTNNLGMPGNWETTLETMRAVDGLRAHLTHIQFHSYGGGQADSESICSRVRPLADYINQHESLTVDVGQVMFGRTTSMTGDGPLGHYLHKISGNKWYSADTELESGCGISPIEYRNKNFVHALQWAIGLEWYLLVDDPWKVVMSTDHPNGGSFLAYPQIIRLLMDSAYRKERLAEVNPEVLNNSVLADLKREYTLSEIAVITRAGPAKILGLGNKGHLGVGADADITVFSPDSNYEQMFALPYLVIQAGQILVEEGEIRSASRGRTLCVQPSYDLSRISSIESWFDEHYSIKAANYGVQETGERRLVSPKS